MDGEAVKDEDIAGVDVASAPLFFVNRIDGDFGHVEVFALMLLNSTQMGTFYDAKWADVNRTVVKGNPGGEKLGISSHKLIVLMGMNDKTLAVRKDEAADGLGMNENLISYERSHDFLQARMMRKGVKGLEIEDLLIGAFECRIRIAAGSVRIGEAFCLRTVGKKPSGIGENAGDICEHGLDGIARQEVTDQNVASGADLRLQKR